MGGAMLDLTDDRAVAELYSSTWSLGAPTSDDFSALLCPRDAGTRLLCRDLPT